MQPGTTHPRALATGVSCNSKPMTQSQVLGVADPHMVIEVVRAIILGPKLFWVPSIVSPLGVVENLAENAPIEVNC